jgi:hypothetical protein
VKRKTVGLMTSGATQRSASRAKLPLFCCSFLFSPQGYSSLLVFAIIRTIGLLWEVSLSHPLALGLHFARCGVCFMS